MSTPQPTTRRQCSHCLGGTALCLALVDGARQEVVCPVCRGSRLEPLASPPKPTTRNLYVTTDSDLNVTVWIGTEPPVWHNEKCWLRRDRQCAPLMFGSEPRMAGLGLAVPSPGQCWSYRLPKPLEVT